jgi:hypothetical protein
MTGQIPGTDRRRPAFLVTIDTEGDNLWARPQAITTRNAGFLPRFHALCLSYGLRPTYLVDYEMAIDPGFREFGREIVHRGTAEIGMHLHAWNTPPLHPLTDDDFAHQPYLTEYPPDVMDQKVATMTHLLEDTFGVKMVSHRAGRWGLDAAYARLLVRYGYRVDCSVTPGVSWRSHRGRRASAGGPDFSHFPSGAYFVDLDDISRPGSSPLLEVPVTIVPARAHPAEAGRLWRLVADMPLAAAIAERARPSRHWLRPNGRNRHAMMQIVRDAVEAGRSYLEFMLHSSELMPGGSPRFSNSASIERLYADLEALFALARDQCRAATLAEFHTMVLAERAGMRQPVTIPARP